MSEINVEYMPSEKQSLFHASSADEVVYGGAKGGGKSCALVMEALAYGLENKGATVYLFRESFDDLEANLVEEWRLKVPQALYKYNETKHLATLINGSRVFFRFVSNYKDAERYRGRNIDFVGVDELTQHEERTIQELLSCVRSPKGFHAVFRATCNPGGIGHAWVKRKYIDGTGGGSRVIEDSVTGNKVAFIQALVYDNPILMKNDPGYVRRLENLPEEKKKAYLYGDWDVFEGQAFPEWDVKVHVIKPRFPAGNYTCYRSLDWGYAKPFSVGWWFIDEDGNAVRYREYYGCTENPDEGVRLDPFTVGQTIASLESIEENIVFGIADSSCWSTDDGGDSVIDLINKALREAGHTQFGQQADKRPGSRLSGKMQLHYRLANSVNGDANGIYICENCRDFIRTIPQLIYDEKKFEDINTAQEDHIYDETRYFLVAHSILPKEKKVAPKGDWSYGELKLAGYSDSQIKKFANTSVRLIGERQRIKVKKIKRY